MERCHCFCCHAGWPTFINHIISLNHKFILKVFHDRKVPPNVLPLNPELMVRVKPAARPDKSDAIAKHQTRMKSTIWWICDNLSLVSYISNLFSYMSNLLRVILVLDKNSLTRYYWFKVVTFQIKLIIQTEIVHLKLQQTQSVWLRCPWPSPWLRSSPPAPPKTWLLQILIEVSQGFIPVWVRSPWLLQWVAGRIGVISVTGGTLSPEQELAR